MTVIDIRRVHQMGRIFSAAATALLLGACFSFGNDELPGEDHVLLIDEFHAPPAGSLLDAPGDSLEVVRANGANGNGGTIASPAKDELEAYLELDELW